MESLVFIYCGALVVFTWIFSSPEKPGEPTETLNEACPMDTKIGADTFSTL